MTALDDRRTARDQHKNPSAPPLRPDPELIGNLEGNKRLIEHDRQVAKRILNDARRRQ